MKVNKFRLLTLLLLCIATLLAVMPCKAQKYYADFKKAKKGVDTLTLLTPYVCIEAFKGQEAKRDYELEERLTKGFFNDSYLLLKKKYQLAGFPLSADSINQSEWNDLFATLEKSDKNSEIPTPAFIQKFIKDNPVRYFLMIFFYGYYNAYYQPYENMTRGLSNNAIYISINQNLRFSDMRALIFDNQRNVVVFYNKKSSKIIDPRVSSDVEKMPSDILKSIYYK